MKEPEAAPRGAMQVVVVAGMSGAGKTVAIKALEDCGYYPLDHLPADTLSTVLSSLEAKGTRKVAIGIDMFDPHFLSENSEACWGALFKGRDAPKVLFLEASDEALTRRYGETRRKHPLTHGGLPLEQAIADERSMLDAQACAGHRIDTSSMSANTLKAYVKNFLDLKTSHMDICLESFGYKHGVPATCDLIFDARCLPNPYYDKALRPLCGLDALVRKFFDAHDKPRKMADQIARFVAEWTPDYERDHRSYLTVGIGCTGGQHRSVYLVERACEALAELGVRARARHREEPRWGAGREAALALGPPARKSAPGA